jgi:hypothetical protein
MLTLATRGFFRKTSTLVSALLAAVIASGCSEAPTGSLTIQVDGKTQVFHANQLVVHGIGGKHEAFSLLAYHKEAGTHPSFDIDLQLPGSALREGKYSAQQLSTHPNRPGVSQKDSLSAQLIPESGGRSYWSQSGREDDAGNFVLEITSITETRMSASFAGPLEDDGNVIQVSGRFDLPYEYTSQIGW